MLNSILQYMPMVLGALLILSEAAAAVVQMVFPDNKGVSGFLAALIKALQAMGAKDKPQA